LNSLTYIDASPEDANLLTDIAINSKKYWGYDDALIRSWKPELEITVDYILRNKVMKVLYGDVCIGFFGLSSIDDETLSLDHIWLKPEQIRKGFGSMMFSEVLRYARSQQYKSLTVVADPHANGFYEKMGGTANDLLPSSIPGRNLAIYLYQLY
jgi:GNAT superfamily N-acetyltransferase